MFPKPNVIVLKAGNNSLSGPSHAIFIESHSS